MANPAAISQNDVFDNSGSYALYVEGDDARIEGNSIRNNNQTGINVFNTAQNATNRGEPHSHQPHVCDFRK